VFLLSGAISAIALVRWWTLKRPAQAEAGRERILPTLPPWQEPAAATIGTEYGAEGTMLRMLGLQLRESIVRGELDPSLIAAAEWALDRHRSRAVRLLSLGLAIDHELCRYLDELRQALARETGEVAARAVDKEEASLPRLLRILRVISPENIPNVE
jgi:hypothetical protein